MIAKGNVYDNDIEKPNAKLVTMKTPIVEAFFKNSRVYWNQLDQKLFDELYTIFEEF